MKRVSKTFLTGLVTVLPILITLYFILWLSTTAESALGRLIRLVLPDQLYRPGMGLAAGLAVVFVVGILMHALVVRRLLGWGENLLYRVPVIKSVYGSIRDFLYFFSPSREKEEDFRQVVMVTLGDTGLEIMGFITRSDFGDLPAGIGAQDSVAVYLPLSYQIGGHTVILPRTAVRAVKMSIKEAMRFALTAGITMKSPPTESNHNNPKA
ncbi:MAG: DUF502 domain-containing protein [Desulfobacteraceae bacterium]|nr:DUF502 domain-containing protein [Desulfobacteraceae bacterium]